MALDFLGRSADALGLRQTAGALARQARCPHTDTGVRVIRQTKKSRAALAAGVVGLGLVLSACSP